MKFRLGSLILFFTILALLGIISNLHIQLDESAKELEFAKRDLSEASEVFGYATMLVQSHYDESTPEVTADVAYLLWEKRETLETMVAERYPQQSGTTKEFIRALIQDILQIKSGDEFIKKFQPNSIRLRREAPEKLSEFKKYVDNAIGISENATVPNTAKNGNITNG